MTDPQSSKIVSLIAEGLEVPDSAYEAAKARYEDLGQWLHDKSKATCAHHSPEVYPQGSFRLGTVVRPLAGDDFDLDLSCVLHSGVTRRSHTQRQLKAMLGGDLRRYGEERSVKEAVEEKRRCWRLNYQGTPGFHMDAVPAIPEEDGGKAKLSERMVKFGSQSVFAASVSHHAVSLTDNEDANYGVISDNWRVGNQEGYAKWFESRMRLADQLLSGRAAMAKVANVDQLPAFQWKSPLQRAVQLLKRHRDVMFKDDPKGRPISAIITTLAGMAYSGESDLMDTLRVAAKGMRTGVAKTVPRVPNPVNPEEDFADKWPTAEGRKNGLAEKFDLWAQQVEADVEALSDPAKSGISVDLARRKFSVLIKVDEERLPAEVAVPAPIPARVHSRPWRAQ